MQILREKVSLARGTVSAKALGQEHAWLISGAKAE